MHGQKLTKEERQYLQAKNPAMYQRVLAAEQEQKSYEQELKRCRTKDEVQRVKQTHLSSSITTLKSVMNNPHISQEKKMEVLATEKYRFERINISTREFVRRGDYERLPTDAEQAKADKIRAEEKRQELGIEENDKDELSESVYGNDANQLSENVSGNDANRLSETVGKHNSRRDTAARSDSRTNYKIETPEERKVRRARTRAAQAAYAAWNSELADSAVSVNA